MSLYSSEVSVGLAVSSDVWVVFVVACCLVGVRVLSDNRGVVL